MPKTCAVCRHPGRVEIDFALLRGEPTRSVSERFDGLRHPQVQGHRRSGHHLPLTPRRGTSPHTAAGLLSRIEDNLGDPERLRALRLALTTLPLSERRALVEGLRLRAGRGKLAEPERRVA